MTNSLDSQEKDEGRQLISQLASLAEIMTVRQGEVLQLAETDFGSDIEIHAEAAGVDYLIKATRKE